jgi:2'-5' RNA ligase
MAMLAIPIPINISRLLQEIKVPGDIAIKDDSGHCTVFYFQEFDMDDVLKIIPVVSEAVENIKSFNISVDSYSSFPSENEVPIICEIKSKELVKMRNKIKKALDENNIEYSTKFKNYKPHVALQYNTKNQKGKFDEIIWPVKNIALYCGDSNKEKLYVEFPFYKRTMKYSSEFINEFAGYFEKIANK